MKLENLFSPFKVGPLQLRNRLVMLAMASRLCEGNGTPSERTIEFYAARAKGGVGLIITEMASIHQTSHVPYTLSIYDDSGMSQWKKLSAAVHAHGAKLFPQLAHRGREMACTVSGEPPLAASAIPCPSIRVVPQSLTWEGIREVVASFANAAARAKEAGCDGVEIHGAHSYLLCDFLSPLSNKRTDEYGGSLSGRMKIILETIDAIKAACGSGFPLSFRLSYDELAPGGLAPQESMVIASLLAEAGIDLINVSRGSYSAFRWLIPPYGTPLAPGADFCGKLKQALHVPVLTGHRINNPLMAEMLLREGKADLIGMGRSLIADPDLPRKAMSGQLDEIIPCISCCYGCVGRRHKSGLPLSCTLNPTVGREKASSLSLAEERKKVMVIGGGLAGMEAADTAALRGHQVTLYEKQDRLGGQFNLACVPPGKQEFSKAVCFLSRRVVKSNVKVVLGEEVTADLVDSEKPDVVIIATGAVPVIPGRLPGINKSIVNTANDLLAGRVVAGAKGVVIGGGLVGCESAEYLAENGAKDVTIIEMLPDVALNEITTSVRQFLLERLDRLGIKAIVSAKVEEITDDGVRYSRDGQGSMINGVTNVILAMGTKSVNDLFDQIKGKASDVLVIGDAKEPRNAFEAIAEGYCAGNSV